MSLKQTQWAWLQSVKPGPKLVLLALADYADEEGQCYPTLKQLRQKTGLGRSTILSHLQVLQSTGLIVIQHQQDSRGYRRNNRYQLQSRLSPDFGLQGVQNLDGNIIYSHIDSHNNKWGPKSGPRPLRTCLNNAVTTKPALEGAI